MALYIAAISSPAFAAALSSDDDIRHALVGNTISGEEDGQAFTEYFKPDGTIAGEEADGRYAGMWRKQQESAQLMEELESLSLEKVG